MKIIIKESQLKLIKENIKYTPEKIEQILKGATKVSSIVEKEYMKQKEFLLSLTIGDIVNDVEKYSKVKTKLENINQEIKDKYNFYVNVLDLYEYDELESLDKIVSILDDYTIKFEELIYIVDIIITSKNI